MVEPVRMMAQSLTIPETSNKEMEEILKIIKRSDYDVVIGGSGTDCLTLVREMSR